jgi:hypothetical protein
METNINSEKHVIKFAEEEYNHHGRLFPAVISFGILLFSIVLAVGFVLFVYNFIKFFLCLIAG